MTVSNKAIDTLFDLDLPEADVVDALSRKEFRKIAEGFSAYVFGDTDMRVVLKIFPPLDIGNPEELQFISSNVFLRYADILTARWQSLKAVRWMRQKAKSMLAIYRNPKDFEKRERSSELCIQGYEISVKRGLMKHLPTRVIPNCVSKLSLNANRRLLSYLEKPDKIVLQKRFREKELLISVLRSFASKNDIQRCKKLINDAVNFQISLWRLGLTNTDMSFNVFDSLLLLPDGSLQIHDVNGINDSYQHASWFIHEKEKDIANIFKIISKGKYPQFLNQANLAGISETARKLYSLFPKKNRDELVTLFLRLSKEILSEKLMTKNWNKETGLI